MATWITNTTTATNVNLQYVLNQWITSAQIKTEPVKKSVDMKALKEKYGDLYE